VLSALLIGGVLAAATDTFDFGGSVAESGDLGIDPPALEADVQIALTELAAPDCEVDTYSDGPLVGTFDVDIDLASIEPLAGLRRGTVLEQRICILNAGTETARLLFEVQESTGSDVDVLCSAGETGAGDTTCGTGDGELDEILFITPFTGVPYGSEPPCPVGIGEEIPVGNIQVSDGPAAAGVVDSGLDIPVGEACPFMIQIWVSDDGDEDLWRRAQTDRLGFDLFVSLETP
jgi:hypothetical protein